MSSINPYYTFEYSQPEDYRFSHDSVFLARQVFELVNKEKISSLQVLDLCSGCGIIGLDFIFHARKELGLTLKMDFLEVQQIYRPHFEINCERLGQTNTQIQFIQKNYETLLNAEHCSQYDLLLCNPPYFFVGMGKLSPSDFKNRCRFYIDSNFEILLKAIAHCLAPKGQAYVLLRDLPQHGWDALKETQSLLEGLCTLQLLGDIRGTRLIMISKNSI
jgi:tRNA1(Val) A37 N6-methylase TrmN6